MDITESTIRADIMHRIHEIALIVALSLLVTAPAFTMTLTPAYPAGAAPGSGLPGDLDPVTASEAKDPDDYPGDYPTVVTRNVSYYSIGLGDIINCKFYYPQGPSAIPAIVFGVGFQNIYTLPQDLIPINLNDYMDYDWIAEALAHWGYAVLVMAFRGNFSEDHALWIEEMNDAVTALIQGAITGAGTDVNALVDDDRIAVMGHNIGGAVAIAEAAADKRVKAVLGLAPWDALGNNMLDEIGHISPVPVQIQTGPRYDPVENWGISGGDIYDAASAPRQLIYIGAAPGGATYEGFTDAGTLESDTVTHQQYMSRYFTITFLQYYLADESDYYGMLTGDYSKGANPPLVPIDPYRATNVNDDLDTIIRDVTLSTSVLDVSQPYPLEVIAWLTPRGIGWGASAITVELEFLDSSIPAYENVSLLLALNPGIHNVSKNNRAAGEYRVEVGIDRYHSLDRDITVVFSVRDSRGAAPVLGDGSPAGTSQPLTLRLTATSDDVPVFTIHVNNPAVVDLDRTDAMEARVEGNDLDGIGWYQTRIAELTSGWKSTSSDSFTLAIPAPGPGSYVFHVRLKDRVGAESSWETGSFSASHPPVAEPFTFKDKIKEGDRAEFDASGSYDPDGDDIQFYFYFGDGSESTWTETPIVKHTYSDPGDFTVKMSVRDEYGLVTNHTDYISVVEKDEPITGGALTDELPLPVIAIVGVMAVLLASFLLSTRKGKEEPMPGQAQASHLPPSSSPPLSPSSSPPLSPSSSLSPFLPSSPGDAGAGPTDPDAGTAAGKGTTTAGVTPGFPLPPGSAGQGAPSPRGTGGVPSRVFPQDDEIIMPRMDAEIIYPKGYVPPAVGAAPVPLGVSPAPMGPGDDEVIMPGSMPMPPAGRVDTTREPVREDGAEKMSGNVYEKEIARESTKEQVSKQATPARSGPGKEEHDEEDEIVYPKGMKPPG